MNKQRHRRPGQGGTSPETTHQSGSGVAHFSVSEVVQFSMSVDRVCSAGCSDPGPWGSSLPRGMLLRRTAGLLSTLFAAFPSAPNAHLPRLERKFQLPWTSAPKACYHRSSIVSKCNNDHPMAARANGTIRHYQGQSSQQVLGQPQTSCQLHCASEALSHL